LILILLANEGRDYLVSENSAIIWEEPQSHLQ